MLKLRIFSRADMAEFRVLAGSSMLKLATKSRYSRFVTSDDLVTLSTLGYVCSLFIFLGIILIFLKIFKLFGIHSMFQDAAICPLKAPFYVSCPHFAG